MMIATLLNIPKVCSWLPLAAKGRDFPLHVYAGLSFPVARVLTMEGSLERMLAEASAANNASLVALQLPLGIKALPSHLVALLRTCRGAVLVVKEGGAA